MAEAQRDCPSIQAAGDSSLTLQLIPFVVDVYVDASIKFTNLAVSDSAANSEHFGTDLDPPLHWWTSGSNEIGSSCLQNNYILWIFYGFCLFCYLTYNSLLFLCVCQLGTFRHRFKNSIYIFVRLLYSSFIYFWPRGSGTESVSGICKQYSINVYIRISVSNLDSFFYGSGSWFFCPIRIQEATKNFKAKNILKFLFSTLKVGMLFLFSTYQVGIWFNIELLLGLILKNKWKSWKICGKGGFL